MRTMTTRRLALSVALVAGLSCGCFGNCGGCVGGALDDSFEALGQAVEKGAQADMEDDLQAEAERELAIAEGREPARTAVRGLGAYLPRADLAGLKAKELKRRLGKLGYKLVGCDEMEFPSGEQAQVNCVMKKKGQRIKLELHDFNRTLDMDDAAASFLLMRQIAVRDEGRLLAVHVADEARSKALLAKLTVREIPSARDMRTRLQGLGYRVLECERSEDEDEIDLTCSFTKGQVVGMAFWMQAPEDGLDEAEAGGRPEWADEELMLSQTRGRVASSVMLVDRDASKALMTKLLPGFVGQSDRVVVLVTMADSKPNGRNWDALGGEPDPYIVVGGKSYRDERCEDASECTFVVPKADSLEIKVIDADGAKDDPAGKTVCRPGGFCETRGAAIQVVEIW